MSYKKQKDEKSSKEALAEFNSIIAEEDPYPYDNILTNWAAYKTFVMLNDQDQASEYLESAYLELKTQSKNIKNKKDRNKFLKTKLHKEIVSSWKNS